MPRRLGCGLGAALYLSACLGAWAQEAPLVQSPILVLDQERLFTGSRAAEKISAEIEAAAEALAEENRRIESELTAEELSLTELRPTMDPGEFRVLADAFDEKVQRLRTEQDAKALDLQRRRDQDRQTFLRQITPLLAEIVRERGAVAVLDRRSVFLSAEAIDITDEAIDRINATFDQDTGLPEDAPAPGGSGETAPPRQP